MILRVSPLAETLKFKKLLILIIEVVLGAMLVQKEVLLSLLGFGRRPIIDYIDLQDSAHHCQILI